jgi:hypothetical protein
MAFALTAARAYAVEIPNATTRLNQQFIELTITRGASGDTAFDFWNPSGTFWTAAKANGTTGELATSVIGILSPVLGQIKGLVDIQLVGNNDFLLQVATASAATNYSVSNAGTYPVIRPVITFNASVAPATVFCTIGLSLNDNVSTVEYF